MITVNAPPTGSEFNNLTHSDIYANKSLSGYGKQCENSRLHHEKLKVDHIPKLTGHYALYRNMLHTYTYIQKPVFKYDGSAVCFLLSTQCMIDYLLTVDNETRGN